jgi:aspartyl-tRNA(Asn)/glutamyl-tRNA(Gln) amidotransferase subunit A
MSAEFDYLSAFEMKRLVARKQISPVDLTKRALAKAEATQKSLNCFYFLMPDAALEAARRAEDAVMREEPLGLLHGLPFSAKDLMAVAGQFYALGSKTMANNIAPVDAPAVERANAAGAILIGKTTTSEFGCKPVGDSPLTGITRHPWNLDKTPGGSSAGAAASVAAGITPFALGTDGGGSIRIPASFSGLVGMKANFARVPVWPTSATPTLAHVCPIARTVRDAALLMTAVAGYDPRDPSSIAGPVPDFLGACDATLAGLRVAWSPTLGYARPDKEVVAICEKVAQSFEHLGCSVELVDGVFDEDPADIWTAEFYAGVGTRLREFVEKQRDLLDPAVAVVLEAALAQDMRDYYEKVFKRYVLRDRIRMFFDKYDLVLSPTLPLSSLAVGKDIPEQLPDRNLVSWVYYTYPFNLTGQPAASICAGIASDGMPVGLQIVARRNMESDIIRAASAYERAQSKDYNVQHFNA